jgi:subtilisin-like proprotein convertase family protein
MISQHLGIQTIAQAEEQASMKLHSFLGLFGKRRQGKAPTRKGRRKGARAGKRVWSVRPGCEFLEDRTLLSVLPPPIVTSAAAIPGSGSAVSPKIAVDPNNSLVLAAVWTTHGMGTNSSIQGQFSTDGGQSWAPFPGTLSVPVLDPTTVSTNTPPLTFPQATDPTVGFDRAENIYVAYAEHRVDNSAGAIVVQKFHFTGVALTDVTVSVDQIHAPGVIYEWAAADAAHSDPALNPAMTVDNNLPSYTDPQTKATQTDKFAGTVYVAWNTNNATGNTFTGGINNIKVVASDDGGKTYTNQVLGNSSTGVYSGPQLIVSQGTVSDRQGTGGVPGGQMTLVWEQTVTTPTTHLTGLWSNTIQDGAADAVSSNTTPLTIIDATDPGMGAPHINTPTLDTTLVTVTDPRFTFANSVDVTVNIIHPNLSQLRIRLLPQAKLDKPFNLTIGPDGNFYISSRNNSSVAVYSGTTGALLKVFIPPAPNSFGLDNPDALVFGPDGNNDGYPDLYISSSFSNQILRFDGKTGAPLPAPGQPGAVFATGNGLADPEGLGVGADGNIYVVNAGSSQVLRFSGQTGAPLPSPGNPGAVFATGGGLNKPEELTFGPDANLYVSNTGTSQVLRFSGQTGAALPAPGLPGAVFATGGGLTSPQGVSFGPDGDLYVADFNTNSVKRFHGPNVVGTGPFPVEGTFLDTFVTPGLGGINGPHGMLWSPGINGELFVVSTTGNSVQRYHQAPGVASPLTGQSGATYITPGLGGLDSPGDMLIRASDANNILIASRNTNSVLRYSGFTGAFLNAFVNAGAGGLSDPAGMAIGPGGDLFISSRNNDRVLRFNGQTGLFTSTFVTTGLGGLSQPTGLVFGPDITGDGVPELYVLSPGPGQFGSNLIMRYNGATGAALPSAGQPAGSAIFAGGNGLVNPKGIAYDAGTNAIYVTSFDAVTGKSQVLRFNANSGNFIGVFADDTTSPLSDPRDIYFAGDGTVYVSSFGNNRILRYRVANGQFLESIVPANNTPVNAGGLSGPTGLAINSLDGKLYVASANNNSVMRYWDTPATGDPAPGNTGATFVAFGGGGAPITLVLNRIDAAGNTLNQGLNTAANMGVWVDTRNPAQNAPIVVGTVFDQKASRSITDTNAAVPYTAHFRPELGNLNSITGPGETPDQINGNWTLEVTDFRSDKDNNGLPPFQQIRSWSIDFSSNLDPVSQTAVVPVSDEKIAGQPTAGSPSSDGSTISVNGAPVGTYPHLNPAEPNRGVGPAPVIASDNTLGSFSPYQGRLYVAYTSGSTNNTNVYLITSDDGGKTWLAPDGVTPGPVQVNDDNLFDGFSEGNRPQFQPSVAVDPYTGTLILSFYDARQDASLSRVNTYVAASIDGGQTFAPQNSLSPTRQAIDAVTGKTVTIENLPNNQSAIGTPDTVFNYGDRQGLAIAAGHLYAIYSGNLNQPGLSAMLSVATFAAGPRIESSSEGVVRALTAQTDDNGRTIAYNSTFAPDGVQQLDGFLVTFDRPIDVSSFTPSDVTIVFHDPNTAVVNTPPYFGGSAIPATQVQAVNGFTTRFGVALVGGIDPTTKLPYLATTFLVSFAPQRKVGTYSYSVGPDIFDKIRIQTATVSAGGTAMDQNSNALTDEPPQEPSATTTGYLGDVYAVPAPSDPLHQPPFFLPYDQTTLPLSIPGPHVVSTFVAGSPPTVDNLVLNNTVSALDVVFDRDMDPSTFTPATIVRLMGPIGQIGGPFTVTADPNPNYPRLINGITTTGPDPDPAHPRTFKISIPTRPNSLATTPGQDLSGTYTMTIAPSVQDHLGEAVDTNENAGLDVLRGANPTAANTTLISHAYNGPKVTLSPGKTAAIPINFNPEVFAIQGAAVQLDITYPFDPDLEATLVAPDGTRIQLFTRVGNNGSRADFTNTIFEDSALPIPNIPKVPPTPIQLGIAPFDSSVRGGFQPQTPLGVLIGKASAGTYTLLIKNDSTNRTGTLNSWSLSLLEAVPGTGLGETNADLITAHFRIFTQDPLNKISHDVFTAIGPASSNPTLTQGNPTGAGYNGFNAGRVTALAVDPSDPSGNTVYIGAASGGIWKTTNFLTQDPTGPVYIPLTDFGPTFAINIGGIAVFGRNNDPNQSIIFASTGDGSSSPQSGPSQGVGILRSMDGGATWTLLDSTNNVDDPRVGFGKLTAINAASRDHVFAANGGTTSFNIAVDPTHAPTGPDDVIVYVALSTPNGTGAGGLWRSLDSGRHWQRMSDPPVQGTDCTDLALALNSKDPASGNVQVLYAAFRGKGVYLSQAQGAGLVPMTGGIGNSLIRDGDTSPALSIPVGGGNTPQGAKGRITLAVPALTGNPVQDLLYQGWVYAAVATATGGFDGLYVTKDAGANWTQIHLPEFTPTGTNLAIPTNNETRPEANPVASGKFPYGNYTIGLAVDPSNPSIVYLGGAGDAAPPPIQGMVRVDITRLHDPHNETAYDSTNPDGGRYLNGAGPTGTFPPSVGSVIPAQIPPAPPPAGVGPGAPVPFYSPTGVYQQTPDGSGGTVVTPPDVLPPYFQFVPYVNLVSDPYNPFLTNATILTTGLTQTLPVPGSFTNDGQDASYMAFNEGLHGSSGLHRLIVVKDPVTGRSRLIFGDNQGVFTSVDLGNGQLIQSIGEVTNPDDPSGNQVVVSGSRNGNLQIAQFYYGAAQPSVLAAEIAAAIPGSGGLFYGNSMENGFPVSDPHLLANGNISWLGPLQPPPPLPTTLPPNSPVPNPGLVVPGYGTGIATDQTGSGSAYSFQWPSSGILSTIALTNFFLVNPNGSGYISRTGTGGTSLVQKNQPGPVPDPQWPFNSTMFNGESTGKLVNSNLAVNLINGNEMLTSSADGRVFRTNTQGKTWFQIGFVAGDPGATPSNTLGNYAAALAYGAPDPANPTGNDDDFIYAGTQGGQLFVTFDGGGHWVNITGTGATGLDGSSVMSITTNPQRATHELYVVTLKGVYHMSFSVKYPVGQPPQFVGPGPGGTAAWQVETGNLFNITTNFINPNNGLLFQLTHDPTQPPAPEEVPLKYLTSIVADWRFTIPDTAGQQGGPTHPALYVGGEGGVFRSLDKGKTWTVFPNTTDDGSPVAGGYLPDAHVTDLSLAVGNINPTTGTPDQPKGPNLLLVTTYGRGSFAIRLPLNSPYNPVTGPRVVATSPDIEPPGISSITVTFSGVVDPSTFDSTLNPNNLSKIRSFTGPNGPIQVLSIQDVTPVPPPGQFNLHNVYKITFPAQSTSGTYVLVLGPYISDYMGNAMDQNQNGINGEDPGDRFTFRFVINTTDNGHYVFGIYQDLLGRGADSAGFLLNLAPLDAARFAILPTVATGLITSPEARTNLVTRYYNLFFPNQPVPPSGVNFWVGQLAQGRNPEDVIVGMVGSADYFSRASIGQNDDAFLTQMYSDVLKRAIDAGAHTNFLNFLASAEQSARLTLAGNITHSDEYYAQLLNGQPDGFYPRFLGRTAAPGDVSFWTSQLHQGVTDEQVIASIVATAEYYSHAPTVIGQPGSPPTDATFIQALYVQLFGRKASDQEVQFWLPQLPGLGRTNFALTLMGTDEYRRALVRGYYSKYLGITNPSEAQLVPYLQLLLKGNTDEQVLSAFLSSISYYQKHNPTPAALSVMDTNWAQGLYQDVLRRPIDAGGLAAIQNFLTLAEQNARATIVQGIVYSDEYRGDLLYNPNTGNNPATATGFYPQLLGRLPAPSEVSFWVSYLHTITGGPGKPSPDEQVEINLVSSQEYFAKLPPDDQGLQSSKSWLTTLYTSPIILNRAPDPAGFNANLNFLLNSYQPQRLADAMGLINSDEYKGHLVSTLYLKYLRRSPGPSEVASQVAFLKAGHTDEQLIQALVSSQEYFNYAANQRPDLGPDGNSRFVSLLYLDLLSRPRDPSSQGLINALNAGQLSRSQVAGMIINTNEYRATLIATYYNQYLHRNPPKPVPGNPNDPEIAGWVQQLLKGATDEQVIASLVSSTEYFLEPHS